MHPKTRTALLGYGLSTTLTEKVAGHGHTVSVLRALSLGALLKDYTEAEAAEIKAKVDRAPIPPETVEAILERTDGVCCFCGDGNSIRPFQLHHIVPYSTTQDNSEENLLLVCPTHHVAIHEQQMSDSVQKSQRKHWMATVELARPFRDKGIPFPFGLFQAIDYDAPPKPEELVQLGPLSPASALICYSQEITTNAEALLSQAPYLIVFGASGSGKSTFAVALGGVHFRRGFRVFRHRYQKQGDDTLKQIFLLLSTAVHQTLLILDDANVWATSEDLLSLWNVVRAQNLIRVILTYTNDDSSETGRLRASGLPNQHLNWLDLKPSVIDALLRNETAIVRELQKYEPYQLGSLGFGGLNSRLSERIRSLGERPQTVYEFMFGLRGDTHAADEELRALIGEDRADIPILYTAIEQIADFERPVSIEETVAACNRVESATFLPQASKQWVADVFNKQIRNLRILKLRDTFTTIHRKWALRLIGAAFGSTTAAPIVTAFLRPSFDVQTASPQRLLRLWSWLDSSGETRAFVRTWAQSLDQSAWDLLVERCARDGLSSLSFAASKMRLLSDAKSWDQTAGESYRRNYELIASAIYSATNKDWYSLRQLAYPIGHAAPDVLEAIVRDWKPEQIAKNIQNSAPEDFDSINWLLSSIRKACPDWPKQIGVHLSLEQYAAIFGQVAKGDVASIGNCIDVFCSLNGNIRRSIVRSFAKAVELALDGASLEDLRIPVHSAGFGILLFFFPDDARMILNAVDASSLGQQLSHSVPRHWRPLAILCQWADSCGSDLPSRIISASDINLLMRQAARFSPDNRYEFRILLRLLARADSNLRKRFAEDLCALVRDACKSDDSESKSIMTAYWLLDSPTADKLAKEIGCEVNRCRTDSPSYSNFQTAREEFRKRDAAGEDYEIELQ